MSWKIGKYRQYTEVVSPGSKLQRTSAPRRGKGRAEKKKSLGKQFKNLAQAENTHNGTGRVQRVPSTAAGSRPTDTPPGGILQPLGKEDSTSFWREDIGWCANGEELGVTLTSQ